MNYKRLFPVLLISIALTGALHAANNKKVTVTVFPSTHGASSQQAGVVVYTDDESVSKSDKPSAAKRFMRGFLAAGVGAGVGSVLASYEQKHDGISVVRTLVVAFAMHAALARIASEDAAIGDLAALVGYMCAYL